jgi:tight adherence protein B
MAGLPTEILVFLGMVFVAVFLLARGMLVPTFGESRQARKRLQRRMQEAMAALERPAAASLLREDRLKGLAPWERQLEELPALAPLVKIIAQAGRRTPVYRVVLLSLALGLVSGYLAWQLAGQALVAVAATLAVAAIPTLRLRHERNVRLAHFEEQLPDAVEVITRALRAGHPFSECLRLVAEEMDDPIAREFELTFADLNYGGGLKYALFGLLSRVPSVSVMAMVTSVLVQKETGGNLAEVLDKMAAVVRGRFRFQRRVRTLSAEARLSGWVLGLTPFVLAAVISVTSPDYLPMLIQNPLGQQLVWGAFALALVGILWIRKLIRIEV